MKIADSPESSSRRDPKSLFATEISITLDKKRVRWRALQCADYNSLCLAFLLEGFEKQTQFLLLEAGWITKTISTGWSSNSHCIFLCEHWVVSAAWSAFCSRVSHRNIVAVPHTSMDNLILFFAGQLETLPFSMAGATMHTEWTVMLRLR